MSVAASSASARSAIRLAPADAELRCELARWALAEGRSLNIDAATAILAARRSGDTRGRRHLLVDRWTQIDVRQVLRTVVPQLWRLHGLGEPPPLGDSMRTFIVFLGATGRLSPNGPSLVALLDATLDADAAPTRPRPPADGPLAPVVRLDAAARQARSK